MVRVEFRSKHPHRTLWLWLEFPQHDDPKGLLDDLATAGWREGGSIGAARMSPFKGRQQVEINKRGSGLFGEWLPNERKRFLAEARRILRRHGLVNVRNRKLTLADLL